MVVLGTASSDAVLPQIDAEAGSVWVSSSPRSVWSSRPATRSISTRFSIYLTLAAVFIAQATNAPLRFTDLLVILGVSLLTSKGAHGIPGSAIVMLAATLRRSRPCR